MHIAPFSGKWTMPLRQKLFLVLSLMTVVPFLVLLFGVVGSIERDLEKRIEAELHGTLDKMAGEVDTILNNQKSLARGLSRVPALTAFAELSYINDQQNYQTRARELEAFFLNYQTVVPSIQALRFIDPEGKTLVKVKEGHNIPPANLDPGRNRYYVADQSSKPFFRNAMLGGKDIAVSDFELGQVTAGADFCPSMMRYSVPIKDEVDTLQGLLVVNMWGKRVDATVEASLGGYPGDVYIVEINGQVADRDGIYLYHKNADYRFANQVGSSYRFQNDIGVKNWNDIKHGSQRGSYHGDDGSIYFYTRYVPFDDRPTQWLLVIETARDTAFAPILALKKSIWFLMAALVVLSLFIAHWASKVMAAPVNELATIITRYADGDLGVRYDRHRRDEIGSAGEAFNYLCENLETTKRERDKAERAVQQSERLAAVGQLAAGIGHEINNPLMNIMSLAELIEHSVGGHDDEQVMNDLHTLQEEGRRCARIVQGILNFARANEPSYRRFNMTELLNDTVSLLHHRLETAELQLVQETQGDFEIDGDPNLLQQVLVNVLLNAIHVSPARSTITIRIFTRDGHVNIEVLDNGPGIGENKIDRIFNPFYSTKPEGEGTGLGLSVSYGIVKKHGGNILLENREEGGVRVFISLPMHGREQPGTEDEQVTGVEEKAIAG